MIRVIKQYGISALLLIVAIFCFFNISKNIEDAFTVITNSLAIFLAIFYFVNFEKESLHKIIQKLIKQQKIKQPSSNKIRPLYYSGRKATSHFIIFIKHYFLITISYLLDIFKKYLSIIFSFIYRRRWELISYLFILLLLIVTLGQFSFLEKFVDLSWVDKYQTIIIVLVVVSGGLTMWHNRERVEKEIEEEKNEEELAEQKRFAEFSSKYPRINKIPVLRNFVKWMYKEGWGYSLGLILIVVLGLVLLIIAINRMIVAIDEGYTLNSVNAYYKFGHLGLTESGASYGRGRIYSYLIALIFPLFNKTIIGLRAINLLFSGLIISLIYFLTKYVTNNKKIALLATFLMCTNWYYIIIASYARNYIFSFLLVIIMLFLGIRLLKSKSKNFFVYFCLILLFFFNYFEGVLLYSLHFVVFLIIIETLNSKPSFKLFSKKIIVGLTLLFGIFIILLLNFKSNLIFILDKFNINFSKIYWEAFMFNGSIFLYLSVLGLILIILAILLSLINKNKKIFSLSIFIIAVLFIQIFLFSNKNSYPQYLADLIIPLIIVLSYFLVNLFYKKPKLTITLFLCILSTSIINIYAIYNQELGYAVYHPNNFEEAVKSVPLGAVIITDMPNTIKIFRPNAIIYALRDNPNDAELVYANGTHYKPSVPQDAQRIKNFQIKNFMNINLNGYILRDDAEQLYIYYDKTPKIMNVNHLMEISKKETVYFILTHNAFGKQNRKDNIELLDFINANSAIINTEELMKNAFDIRTFNRKIFDPRLLTIMRLN